MHSLNRSWRPERGRPTKRKAYQSLNRENTKRKVEHSNLPSKKQLPVDYSIGKFLLVYALVWSKFLQNIKCSECGEQELSVEFSDAIGHSSKLILKCMSCSWVAGESYSNPRTEAKPAVVI